MQTQDTTTPAAARVEKAADFRMDPMALLPFVKEGKGAKGKSRVYWDVAGTGRYDLDSDLGGMLAGKAIDHMRQHNQPFLLGWIVESMIERGSFTGVEIGFLAAVGAAAMRGYQQ
ncbi:MAG: hypothetical protein LDL44_00635 [Caenispirillum sp.]|nr:hypothetical protein [Caenispirillum sp.]